MTDFSGDRAAANDTQPFPALGPLDDEDPTVGDERDAGRSAADEPGDRDVPRHISAPTAAGAPGPSGSFTPTPSAPSSSTGSFAPTVSSSGSSSGSFAPPTGPSGPAPSVSAANGGGQRVAEVKGRIEVADEVVEKVAGLAAMEVPGVADLGGDIARALESVRERIGIGQKRGDQGIKARITGRDVGIDVVIMIEYGYVVMDVARAVKQNVAVQANRMLGLRVVEVNVIVDDVRLPKPPPKPEDEQPGDGLLSIDS